jgi:hypothetical protein
MTINDLITELIGIGRDEAFDRLPALIGSSQDHRSGQFMRQSPNFWIDIGATLSAQEIIALIKALTVTEREVPKMKAGSVSPVIWLCKHLRQRFPGEYTELEEWILKETDNDYLPWGTSNHGARSLDEFRRLSSKVAQRREERQRAEKQRHIEAQKRKAHKATHDLVGAIRRKDIKAIIALRHRGADVSATDERGKSFFDLAHESGDAKVVEAVTMVLKKEE